MMLTKSHDAPNFGSESRRFGRWLHAIRRKDEALGEANEWGGQLRAIKDDIRNLGGKLRRADLDGSKMKQEIIDEVRKLFADRPVAIVDDREPPSSEGKLKETLADGNMLSRLKEEMVKELRKIDSNVNTIPKSLTTQSFQIMLGKMKEELKDELGKMKGELKSEMQNAPAGLATYEA
eukprot:717252-Prymnesium_polylepis.2